MTNYNNDSNIEIWDNLPIWLQWILYVPVVFAVPSILIFLLNLWGLLRGDFEGIFLYLQTTFNSGVFAFIFVWLAINLAPKAKKLSAWILYSFLTTLVLLFIARYIYTWFWAKGDVVQQDVLGFLQSLAWLGVGIPSLLYFSKKLNNNSMTAETTESQ